MGQYEGLPSHPMPVVIERRQRSINTPLSREVRGEATLHPSQNELSHNGQKLTVRSNVVATLTLKA